MRRPGLDELRTAERGYIGGPTQPLSACVIWPNDYATGAANLGHQRVWELIDTAPGWCADRLYAGEPPTGRPVSFAWERPPGDFDLLLASTAFEADYPALLELLAAAGLLSDHAERRGPLVIAGGIAPTLNPRSPAPFVDAVYRGDAEVALPGLLAELAQSGPLDRRGLWELLAERGLYVDALGEPAAPVHHWTSPTGTYAASRIVSRRAHFGATLLVELGRGCPRGCTFCAARWAAGSWRPAEPAALREQIAALTRELAVQRVGLVGTAVAEAADFHGLLNWLETRGLKATSSSLRADLLTPKIARSLVRLGQRTLTLSAEAGTQRLRRSLAKGLDDDDLLRAAESVAAAGAERLKLYFIYGLPGETDADLEAVGQLCARMRERLGRTRLEVSASPLVPKPLTPLAGTPLPPATELRRKRKLIHAALRRIGVGRPTGESPRNALWQAALSRGDETILRRLREGVGKGALIREALAAGEK